MPIAASGPPACRIGPGGRSRRHNPRMALFRRRAESPTPPRAPMRSLEDLVHVKPPAWPWLAELIERSRVPVRVIPADPEAASTCLYRLQVSVASALGAVAFNTGGLIVDHGWLRILGCGGEGLTDLAMANALGDRAKAAGPPSHLVVAYDVVGGRFAVNGGGLPGPSGQVHYWGPDTLSWHSLGFGHSAFIEWTLAGSTVDFYSSLRWPGWEEDAESVAGDQGILLYPPPFSAQGQDTTNVARKVVSWDELVGMYDDFSRQMGELPPGTEFQIVVTDD